MLGLFCVEYFSLLNGPTGFSHPELQTTNVSVAVINVCEHLSVWPGKDLYTDITLPSPLNS